MNLFPAAQWIFFDVGYTLLDETPAWDALFAVLSEELAKIDRPTSTQVIWQTFRQCASDYEPKQWNGLILRLAADAKQADHLDNSAEKNWHHGLQVPHDRAGDVLKLLSARYKLGVIANQALGTEDRLRAQGWMEYISLVIGSAEASVNKPDPKIFRLALEKAGCTPAEAVMVGDRIDNDITPAKALGFGTIHVRQGVSGQQKPRTPAEEPTATVAAIADVPRLFDLHL